MRSPANRSRFLGTTLVVLLTLFAACKTTLEPPVEGDSRVLLDPDSGNEPFTLKNVITGPPERPVRLALLGRNLRFEGQDVVALDVSLANRSDQTLSRDLLVWLFAFQPEDVVPLNADLIPPAPDNGLPIHPVWGFDYSELLGPDGVLSPGEVSETKPWIFHTPELAPFSFGADVEVQLEPPVQAHLSGRVFVDENQNGRLDPSEPPFPAGVLVAHGPGGDERETRVGSDGLYRFGVLHAGLYTLRYLEPPLGAPLPLELTTPNPLQVILLPGPDGSVRSFENAHFGVRPFGGPRTPPIFLTDAPPDSILQDSYTLLGLDWSGHILHTRIGFSGCSPDHPLQLYMSGGFMESDPVRARLVLMHDDLGEPCDAWFDVTLDWDLTPLVESYRSQYDIPEGRVILVLITPNGDQHELLFEF